MGRNTCGNAREIPIHDISGRLGCSPDYPDCSRLIQWLATDYCRVTTLSIKRKLISHLNRSPLLDNFVYTSRHGLSRGLKRQGGLGWLPSFIPRLHEWDAEEDFLGKIDFQGMTVYDVGGDQGLFTLFFASRVGKTGRVVTFEPNQTSLARIRRNIVINGLNNVTVIPRGLAESQDRLQFVYPASEPALGAVAYSMSEGVNDIPEVEIQKQNMVHCEIEVNSLDNEIAQGSLPVPDFIKLDVEGMEYPALKGMVDTLCRHRPRLYIEMHGDSYSGKLANTRNVVAFLDRLGYRIRHIESGSSIDNGNVAVAVEGHLYCDGAAPADSADPGEASEVLKGSYS